MSTRYPSNFTYVARPGHWHHVPPGHSTCGCGATFCTTCRVRTRVTADDGWAPATTCIRCGGPDQPTDLREAKLIACHPTREYLW